MPSPWSAPLVATTIALTGLPAGAAAAPDDPAADPAAASAGGSVALGGGKADANADAKKPKKSKADKGAAKGKAPVDDAELPWIKRYAPTRNMAELGVFGGVMIVSDYHDFFNPDSAPPSPPLAGPILPLWRLGPDVGARVAFFPSRFFGLEVEGAAMPTRARNDNDDPALLYGVRGHGILQLPYRLTPFLLGGYGLVGVSSDPAVLGNDIDPVGHWGGGAKLFLNKWLALRLEARHLIGAYQGRQRDSAEKPHFTSHVEILAGLSVTLGRPKPPPPVKDSDGDRVLDADDKCPFQPSLAADGCPIGDRDSDGILDDVDQCPEEVGVLPAGCPIRDSDGDGFMDPDDKCPDEPGIAPDGCPIRDRDGDGFVDEVDRCPDDPETKNGYQDDDGCPDELPEEVKKFTGVIEGIFFDFNSDKIQKKSTPTLTKAVEALTGYKEIRVEITGHTDNVGSRDFNLDLSRRRAEAVRQWLLDKGIEPARITTRGAGPDEPIDTNDTAAGRAKNRRIEFKVLTQ